jgi:mRNA-degrading endonuclease RelE of RelBE toxin-antitoxin system
VTLAYTPEFKRNLRTLAKKYRHIQKDVQPVLDCLMLGQVPGDQVKGTEYTIYKVRVKNSDAQKGKSGGYRLIYYIVEPTQIILVTIYSKLEQSDISASDIRAILSELE